MNFRVLRHQVDAVEQQRLADFQEQLATPYPPDDPRWESITEETERLVRIAERKLKAIFIEQDIPEWARPGLHLSWFTQRRCPALHKRGTGLTPRLPKQRSRS
jgi:hypothetical protein